MMIGKQRPKHKKLREGIAPAAMADVMVLGMAGPPFGDRLLNRLDQSAHGDHRPGHQRKQHDGEVVPQRLLMHVAVGGEPFEVVFEEKDAQEIGIAPLYRDIPGQHHREVEKHPGDPDRAPQQGPLPPQRGEAEDDAACHDGSYGTFGERGNADEKVEVEEPEFLVGLIPGIPAEHADAEGRRHLHIGRCAAGKADDAGARSGNQSGIQLASRAEAAHMQINQGDQDESKTGGREPRRPVVDPELQKGEHGAPVVERGFFQPGMAPKNGSDVVVAEQHLAGNLRVAGLVGANQAEPIAAEDRHQSIEQEKRGENEKG